MKRTTAFLLVCLLLCMLVMPVSAAPEGPQITLQPQNYHYPEYSVAIYTVKATGTNLTATWYLSWQGNTYNISDYTNAFEPWEAYAGESYGPNKVDANTFICFFAGIEEELSGAEIWCVIEDGHYDVTSARAIITVQGTVSPPEILDIPASVTAAQGDPIELRCISRSNSGAQLSFQWYETSTGKLPNIQALIGEDSDYIFCNSDTAGTRYYVCCVTDTNGGMAYSSVVPVTVTAGSSDPEMQIQTKSLPDAVVGENYQCKLSCNDPSGSFLEYYNPGKANDFSKTGLTLSNNVISGAPQKAGTFTFTLCAAGDYGEDYAVYTLTVKEAPQEPEETIPEPTEATEVDPTESAENEPTEAEPAQNAEPTQPSKPDSGKFHMPWWGYLMIVLSIIGLGVCLVACIGIIIVLKKKS